MAGGKYDFVVLGGGHNGLLATIYLAKAGFKVCCLEANEEFGGGTRSKEFAPGYIADVGGMVHNMISRTPIVREDELELFSKFGLEYKYLDSLCCSIFPDESHLILYSSLDKTCEEIAKFSDRDAEKYREFVGYMSQLLGAASAGIAGVIPKYGPMMNILSASDMGLEFLRLLNSSAQQIVDEWFETEQLRVTLTRWCTEMMIDPRQIGTSALLTFVASLHHPSNPGAPFPVGGCVNFVNALMKCAESYGAELFNNEQVNDIKVSGGEVKSVVTAQGNEYFAKEGVISTINIHHVFKYLGNDAPERDAMYVKKLKHCDFVALNQAFALNTEPVFKTGEQVKDSFCIEFAPEEEEYLKIFSNYRFGEFKPNLPLITMPYLNDPSRCPDGHSVVNIYSYAPWALDGDPKNWESQGEKKMQEVWEFFKSRTENITDDNIVGHWGHTPMDYSKWDLAFINGDIGHIGLQPSQSYDLRPIPGAGHQYHGEIENLYFLGASGHPGGGIAGNARIGVQKVLEDYDIDFRDLVSR